jgi:hypothetical protein
VKFVRRLHCEQADGAVETGKQKICGRK